MGSELEAEAAMAGTKLPPDDDGLAGISGDLGRQLGGAAFDDEDPRGMDDMDTPKPATSALRRSSDVSYFYHVLMSHIALQPAFIQLSTPGDDITLSMTCITLHVFICLASGY